MTLRTSDTDIEDSELEAFRAEAAVWLAVNAEPRSPDSSEAKRRITQTSVTREEELAEVEEAKRWQRRLFDAGFAGIAVPAEYGGRGLTPAHHRVWREEVGKYATPALQADLGNALTAPTLLVHGTEEQKRRNIPPVLRGEAVWCQLFSEPGAGSDLAGLTTTAVRDGDEWVVNGQKVWNSYAHVADWGILLARTDWDVPKHRGISYFLVYMKTPGVEPRPLRQATGAAHFDETFLTDVRIPEANLVGGLNNGWAVAQTTLMNERAGLGRVTIGGIDFSDWVELARHYGKLHEPDIRQRLAQFYTRTMLIRWLGARAEAATRRGSSPGPESSVVKLLASLDLGLSCDLALAIEGADAMLYAGSAFEDGFWQQFFLDQWSPRIGGGTENIQRNVMGERMLGLPAEARPDKTLPFREVPRNG